MTFKILNYQLKTLLYNSSISSEEYFNFLSYLRQKKENWQNISKVDPNSPILDRTLHLQCIRPQDIIRRH